MTRKKIIKNIMSYGIQRNQAEMLASLGKSDKSYQDKYDRLKPLLMARGIEEQSVKAFIQFGKAAIIAAKSLKELSIAISI